MISILTPSTVTVEAYFARAAETDIRHEYRNGELVPIQFQEGHQDVITNPLLIAEVLSNSI